MKQTYEVRFSTSNHIFSLDSTNTERSHANRRADFIAWLCGYEEVAVWKSERYSAGGKPRYHIDRRDKSNWSVCLSVSGIIDGMYKPGKVVR